jgi:uncharacterized protein YndB with AHSA1/START domain
MAPAKTRTVQVQTFVHTSTKRAFEAISNPKLLKGWLLDNAELTPRKGGTYSFSWTGGPTHTGRVLDYVSGKKITLTWQWPGMEKRLTTKLMISVEAKAKGAIVRFTHSGFPREERWVELYGGAIQGWTYFSTTGRAARLSCRCSVQTWLHPRGSKP